MNSQNLGGATLSKFGNFTIRNGRKVEESVKKAVNGTNEGDQKSLKEIKNGQQISKNANPSGVAKKETSRAPLGEFVLNASSNCHNNLIAKTLRPQQLNRGNGAAQSASDGFEIYTEFEGEEEEKGIKVQKEQEISKTNSSTEVTLLSPGKENIKPAEAKTAKAPDLQVGKCDGIEDAVEFASAFGGSESSELGEEDDDCPSEYMTAHCSIRTAAEPSTKKVPLQIKNPIYSVYDSDIYSWMLYRERKGQPRYYMPRQTELNEEMRAVLIDWFVDVVAEFELSPATFFLAVSITDRTLSLIDCPRVKLQLLGGTALLLASKIHEIFPPNIKDIVYVTDDSYNEEQVQRMEKIVLKATDFQLGLPLVDSFAEFFDHFSPTPLDKLPRHMMWYLLELSTLNFRAVHYLPSRLGAAAFLIALCIQQERTEEEGHEKEEGGKREQRKEEELLGMWSDEMERKTRILRGELAEPVRTLLKIHGETQTSDANMNAIRKKFTTARRDCVAQLQLPSFLR